MMDLIRRSQAGDEDAFASLFHGHKNLVFRTAYLMLGSAEEAEDALQEVFVQVHRSLSSFRSEKGAFTTWLYRITVNHCLNRRRRWLHMLPLDRRSAGTPALSTPGPEERPGGDEAVRQAIGRLSDKLRTVVILRYYSQLSYDEIAQVLAIPVGTVKSRLHEALRALQQQLDPAGDDLGLRERFAARR